MDEGRKKGLTYLVSEEQIREDFVNYLLETEEIPPDASTTAQIVQINKQYQLVSKCEGPYTVHWGATCIWEHTEEYTYQEDVVVFVDKFGNEFSYQYDGTSPVSKKVTKTGHKTVTDKIETVNRIINDRYSELVPAQGVETPLLKWVIERFGKSEATVISLQESDFSGCVATEPGNGEKVSALASSNCKSTSLSYVKKLIPGSKYRDFTFDFESDFKISAQYYVPVYHVIYTYNHHQYEMWFSGYEKGVYFCEKMPGAASAKSYKKAGNCLFVTSAGAFILDALVLILAALIGNSQPLSTMWVMLCIAIALFVVFIGSLIAGAMFERFASSLSGRWAEIKSQLSNIYNDQEMTLQTKKLKMSQLVKQFTEEETEKSRRRRKRILIPSIAVLVIIASVPITKQIIIPMAKYNNAEKLLASGRFDEAAKAFLDLGDFRDSKNKVAEAFVSKGDYVSAIALYEEMGNHEKVNEYTPFATEQQVAQSKEVARQTKVGSVITIGDYDAVVLGKETDRILIMLLRYSGSDSSRNFNTVYQMSYDYQSSSWETSRLRSFLNGDFLDEFHESIRRLILEVELPNITQSDEDLGTTKDKVFLLSAVSDKRYIDAIIENGVIINSTTFTRTPADSSTVVCIEVANYFDGTGNHYSMGEQEANNSYYIRPCMWLDIS